jgi:hypothetical protein
MPLPMTFVTPGVWESRAAMDTAKGRLKVQKPERGSSGLWTSRGAFQAVRASMKLGHTEVSTT